MNLFEAATHIAAAGISVLPVDAEKLPLTGLLPTLNGKRSWKPFQEEIADERVISAWFSVGDGVEALATIGGAVSGNLEILDFDVHGEQCLFDQWAAQIDTVDEGLVERLVINSTPSGGVHVRYRCRDVEIPGNLTLAKLSPREKVIETRGEGGYALCPPSVGYRIVKGSLLNLPEISADERALLLDTARMFNRVPKQAVTGFSKGTEIGGDRPGDSYNRTDDFKAVLVKHGWACVSTAGDRKELWKRPGTQNRWSATWNAPESPGLFYLFTDNAAPFESETGYTPFAVFALLEHGGDFSAAAKALADNGFGPGSGGGEVAVTVDEDRIEKTPQFFVDIPFDTEKYVPPGTWLEGYINYINPSLDAPEQFHLACGMFCLSMACHKMYINFGQSRIKPLMWLALVAPSGIGRKSVSVNTARYLLEDTFREGLTYPNSFSPEAFVAHMGDGNETGFFTWPEMQSQLEAFEKSYMRGYKADLTDLFDCPRSWMRKTKSDGEVLVEEPFVGILAASTQTWLNECLAEGNLKGGFLPRFLWCMAFSKRRLFDWPVSASPEAREQLIGWLKELNQSFTGGMTISPEAKSLFVDQARQLEAESLTNDNFNDILSAFYTRLIMYTLKFSLLYQADIQLAQNIGGRKREIGDEAMRYAIHLSEYFKESILLLLDQMTFSDEMADWKQVQRIIREEPGVTRSQLMRKSRLSKKRLDEALATLFDSELVTFRTEKQEGRGRPTEHYYPLLDEGEEPLEELII